MSKRSEKAKELFKSGYNCSQSVLGVFCEEYGLDFDMAIKLSSGFGGGMGRMREVCGTVSGMFMVLGLIFATSNSSATDKANNYKRVQKLAQIFNEKNGSIICRELLKGVENSNSPIPSERNETYYKKRPCINLVEDAVEILETFIKSETSSTSKDI